MVNKRKPDIKLSEAQIRALKYLMYQPPGVWVSGTPVTQKCINTLASKGLIESCHDMEEGFLEKITKLGRKAILNQGIKFEVKYTSKITHVF